MPAYNGAATLARAYASIAAQTWTDWEFVICDDVSSDDTVAQCEALAARDPRVRFVRNESNLGAFGTVARLLSIARGRYFCWVCTDDYWHPEFLAKLVRALESRPDSVAAMGATEMFADHAGEHRARVMRIPPQHVPQNRSRLANAVALLTNFDAPSEETTGKNALHHFIHGLVERTLFAETLRCFDGAPLSDREFVSVWALAGTLVYVDEVLFYKDTPKLFSTGGKGGEPQELVDKRVRVAKDKKARERLVARGVRTAAAYYRSTWISEPLRTAAAAFAVSLGLARSATRIAARARAWARSRSVSVSSSR